SDDFLSFPAFRIRNDACELRSAVPVGAERFGLAFSIVADDGICRIQDVSAGAVVLFVLDHCRLWVVILEIQYVRDIRPADFIDGLIGITNYAYVAVFFS